jgi:hypothetical protein
MKTALERLLAAAAALLMVLAFGAALSTIPTLTHAQADESPKDCTMKPEDPRCKDDKKYRA